MYPKNSASPPPYDVGALIQISDGAVQTSGESVRVKIGTGAWGAGAGTAACDATSGIYTYSPSQAETNAESFIVAIYKTGCVPISRTVVTSASATSGYAGTDQSKIVNPTATVALTGTTIASGSGTESDLMVSTTIDTLTSQTVFTLTAGSADDDAYNRQLVVITDAATSTQKARGIVSDYVGATKTLTLTGAPAFTIAAGDSISIIAVGSDVSSTQVLSAVSSAIVSAGITTTVTGMPTFLRVGDARTVANGGAIPVRLYDVDDDSLLFGLGESLFADATITFSLRRAGTDSSEGAEDAAIPCTWVEDGADGYVQIAYDADALDDCDAMDKLKEKDCHRWGIKFQWGTSDPITPVYGNISVLRKIVTTQS